MVSISIDDITTPARGGWLNGTRSQSGHCGLTRGPADCSVDDKGSVDLRDIDYRNHKALSEACAAACSRCARCRFISYSVHHRDCSWYALCEKTHHNVQHFTTQRAPLGRGAKQLRQSRRCFAATHKARPPTAPKRLRYSIAAVTPPSLAMGALALASHTDLRCFQRMTVRAYVLQGDLARGEGGWLPLVGGGRFALRYLLPSTPGRSRSAPSPQLAREHRTYGDMLFLRSSNHEFACAEKLLQWFRLASELFPDADFIGVTDEDAWLHPPRLLQDLAIAPQHQDILYGQISWARDWDVAAERHIDYANGDQLASMVQDYAERASACRPGALGPFPFALGFLMVLSAPLARAAGLSPGFSTMVASLNVARQHGSRKPINGPAKCDPATDTTVGHVVAHLLDGRPITLIDASSTDRVHLWRSLGTHGALKSVLAVLHGAKLWKENFQWALCQPRQLDTPPSYRCRSVPEWAGLASEVQSRDLSRNTKYRDAGLYLHSRFGNWTICALPFAFESGGVRVGPDDARFQTAKLQTPYLCDLSEQAMLQQCRIARGQRMPKNPGSETV